MKKPGTVAPMSNRAIDRNVKEIAVFLRTIGCSLGRKKQIKYEVTCGRDNTGLAMAFWQEIGENNKILNHVMAVMSYPAPFSDQRYHKKISGCAKDTIPCVLVDFSDKKEKALLYEFISRAIFFFRSSKVLRQWRCCNCGEVGYEVFLNDGSIGTFEAECREFRLLIVDRDNAVEGAVYDDLICKYVKPICSECLAKLGYTENDDGYDQGVDKLYFKRFIRGHSEAREMGTA